MPHQLANMSLTPSASTSQLSVMIGSSHAVQSSMSFSAPQHLKYLQKRITEIESELEQKRVQLFASEEARAELEARIDGSSTVTPPSETTDTPLLENNLEELEQPSNQGAGNIYSGPREEQHQQVAHNFYQRLITRINRDHKEQMDELHNHYEKHSDRIKEDHEAEIQQTKSGIHYGYETILAAQDRKYNLIEAELAACRAELDIMHKHYEAEKAETREYHEGEHLAGVREYEALLGAHKAEITAMETGTYHLYHRVTRTRLIHSTGHDKTITDQALNHEAEMKQIRKKQAFAIVSLNQNTNSILDSSLQAWERSIAEVKSEVCMVEKECADPFRAEE